MKQSTTLISIFLYLILLSPCEAARQEYIKIATFNIENLTAKGKNMKQIAQIIKYLGLEIVGIEEIVEPKALDELVKYLGGFKYKITGGTAPIHVGIIYNSTVIDISEVSEIKTLTLNNERKFRPGLRIKAKVKPDGFDFILAVVHLKSKVGGEETDSYRKQQVQCLSNWIDKELQAHPLEKDIIVLGDFNETLERNPFTPLSQRKDIKILTGDLVPGSVSYIGKSGQQKYRSLIDHIILYKGKGGCFDEYKPASIGLLKDYDKYQGYNVTTPPDGTTLISDHVPVYASFLTKDND
ncbi:MAG: endonuclease/exonuclease/phosphatase family protein [Candidatus Desantisbacteria bacterium]